MLSGQNSKGLEPLSCLFARGAIPNSTTSNCNSKFAVCNHSLSSNVAGLLLSERDRIIKPFGSTVAGIHIGSLKLRGSSADSAKLQLEGLDIRQCLDCPCGGAEKIKPINITFFEEE